MKARAGFFTLLIALVSLAGIGATTPDLSQNSDPTEIYKDAVVQVVAAEYSADVFTADEVFVAKDCFDSETNTLAVIETLQDQNQPFFNPVNDVGKDIVLINYEMISNPYISNRLKPPRDGLNCDLSPPAKTI